MPTSRSLRVPGQQEAQGNAAGNVLKSLLKKGLIKEVRAKLDDTVWRHDKDQGKELETNILRQMVNSLGEFRFAIRSTTTLGNF